MTCVELVARWEEEAALLERYGDVPGAAACRLHADQLREALRTQAAELLTPAEAAKVSGYSERRLRELVTERRLENHGRKGSPRYRRSELPRKAGRNPDTGFDPEVVASRIVRKP